MKEWCIYSRQVHGKSTVVRTAVLFVQCDICIYNMMLLIVLLTTRICLPRKG